MKVSLKQMFSIVDGRLSTNMDDVYAILNKAIGMSLQTLELPSAVDYVREKNPFWYEQAKTILDKIKSQAGNDFDALMKHIDEHYSSCFFEVECINFEKQLKTSLGAGK